MQLLLSAACLNLMVELLGVCYTEVFIVGDNIVSGSLWKWFAEEGWRELSLTFNPLTALN